MSISRSHMMYTRAARVLLDLGWHIPLGVLRGVFWDSVYTHRIRLEGQSPFRRAVVGCVLALLTLLVASLFLAPFWRAHFELVEVSYFPEHPITAPTMLFPMTMFALSVAWACVLTGTLSSHWTLRVATVLLFLIFVYSWRQQNVVYLRANGGSIAFALPWTIPMCIAARWKRREASDWDFPVLLILCGANLIQAQGGVIEKWGAYDDSSGFALLRAQIGSVADLAIPLLVLIGIDMARFVFQVAKEGATHLGERLPARLVIVALIGLAAWRLDVTVTDAIARLDDSSARAELRSYAGAMVVALITGLAWAASAWVRRCDGRPARGADDVAELKGQHFLLLLVLVLQSLVLLRTLLTLWSFIFDPDRTGAGIIPGAWDLIPRVAEAQACLTWWLFLGSGCVVVARVCGWRHFDIAALYLGLLGGWLIWSSMLAPDRPLETLSYQPVHMGLIWYSLYTLIALVWLVKGHWTVDRLVRLLFLFTLTTVSSHLAFAENPFNLAFGSSLVVLAAIGIGWDLLTAGDWVNGESAALARSGRIFLYLGFLMFTVAIFNWAVVTHEVNLLAFLDNDVVEYGYGLLGTPLLNAVAFVAIMTPGALVAARNDGATRLSEAATQGPAGQPTGRVPRQLQGALERLRLGRSA